VVVEDRYSSVFKLERVRPSLVAEGLAETQVRFPEVPIVFCETRPLAQEWAYRFLGAAREHHLTDLAGAEQADRLPVAGPLPPAEPTPAEVRAWAKAAGIEIGDAGRIPRSVRRAWDETHRP
jgi:uncharacterized protein YciI